MLAPQSRNRRAGELLAAGVASADIPARIGQAVESLESVPLLAHALANAGVVAPVTSGLAELIEGELPLDDWVGLVRTTVPPPARFPRASGLRGRDTGRACWSASAAGSLGRPVAVTRTSEPWTALLDEGREDGRLVREAFEGAREPQLAPIPETLHPGVIAALEARGIDALYAHQAEAVDAAWAGPTIVTTGTASGKSLAFQLPTLDVLCRDRRPGALPVPDQGPGPGPGALRSTRSA